MKFKLSTDSEWDKCIDSKGFCNSCYLNIELALLHKYRILCEDRTSNWHIL